ncbi:hypothetical protein Hanom_Chr04g00307151 [Helianthus anomalus]
MDGVDAPDKYGKISNVLDPNAENKPLDGSRKTGQTSGTKMAFYYKKLIICKKNILNFEGVVRLPDSHAAIGYRNQPTHHHGLYRVSGQ